MAEHGTRSCYIQGCRRDECREAERLYRRTYRQRHAVRYPTVKARHLRVWSLYGEGLTYRAIADATGYCVHHVGRILAGRFGEP